MENTRTYLKIFFVAETEIVLSEKAKPQGSVAIATLTRGEAFAAKSSQFMAERIF